MVKHGNYWFSTKRFDLDVTAGLPKKTDVAIIGGGVAGYTLLLDLVMNTSLSVVLLEGASPGFHTSGRNIGHIQEIDPVTLKHIRRTRGDDVASMYVQGVRLNNEWIRDTVKREDIDCDYARAGGIYLSNVQDDDTLDSFSSFHAESCHEPLTKNAVSAVVGADRFERAVYVPGEATLNPLKYVYGLHELSEQVGRHALLNAQVQRVTKVSNGLKLYIRDRGTFLANSVVYCTGGYTIDLLREFKGNVALWKTHAIGSSKLDPGDMNTLPRQAVSHLDKTIRVADDRILVSGGFNQIKNPACDGIVEQSSFQRLNSWWRSVFPSIPKTISANSVWSYINCTGKDGLPLIGPIKGRPGEYMNVGGGLNFSFVAAYMLRVHLSDDLVDDRWSAFYPSRAISEQK